MKIDITKLLEGTTDIINIDTELEIDRIKNEKKDIRIVNPVKITGDIYNTEDGIFLHGEILYEYVEHCARCLKEVNNKMSSTLSAKILNSNEEQDDEEFVIYYQRNRIDLYDPVMTSILLSLPMKTLCSEACEGLCPECGIDLNTGECKCDHDNTDPRFAKLKDLFD